MKIFTYIKLFVLGVLIVSCVQDDVVVGDHFIDYEIPDIPVEQDYVVGAHYAQFEFRDDVTEEPSIGLYDPMAGDPAVYQEHVSQAQNGGIDYFIFDIRSANVPEEFSQDSAWVAGLLSASNASNVNFAISYNFGNMDLADGNRIEDAGLVDAFLADFDRLLPFFQEANYQQVDGRAVLFMNNGHNLYANDNAGLYDQLRTQMSGNGVGLFIVGEQNEWTPPLRYNFRFQDGVDAVTHSTYINIPVGRHDRMLWFHNMADLAWSYHGEKFGEISLEYAPTISPSFDPTILNAGSNNYVFEKDEDWFANTCNVARKNAGANRLVFVDSFNDWNRDTQMESAVSYGDGFLSQLRSEFKVN